MITLLLSNTYSSNLVFLLPEDAVVIGTMVVLAGEVLLEAALHTNGIDAEFETVIHFPSDTRTATYQREPDGSPKSVLSRCSFF